MRWHKAIAATMASLFFLSTTGITAIEAGAALKEAKQLTVQQGQVRGTVVGSNGQGLDKAVVDVRDSKGDVVSAAVTKKDGSFCLASVPAGDYVLAVNGEASYSLHVAKDAQADSVSLVAPPRYSAGQEETGMSTTAKVAAGVGVAALVGLAVVLSDDDDDDGDDCQ